MPKNGHKPCHMSIYTLDRFTSDQQYIIQTRWLDDRLNAILGALKKEKKHEKDLRMYVDPRKKPWSSNNPTRSLVPLDNPRLTTPLFISC